MGPFLTRLLFFVTIFFPIHLKSVQLRNTQELSVYFSKENCDPDSLVASRIHVNTGKLVISRNDFTIQGPEKINIQRNYTSQELWSYFPYTVLVVGESDEKSGFKRDGKWFRYMKALCGGKSGELLSSVGWLADGVEGKLQPAFNGMVNCAQEEISGKTNPKNVKVGYSGKEDGFEIITGNGSKRIYAKVKISKDSPFEYVLDGPLYKKFTTCLKNSSYYLLQKEFCSNGTVILYSYDQQSLLKEIRVIGAKEQTLGFCSFTYKLNESTPEVVIQTSCDSEIHYFFERMENQSLRLIQSETQVGSSRYIYEDNKLVKEVSSDGSFFEVTYGPDKENKDRVSTYASIHERFSFSYDISSKTPSTSVIDVQKNTTKYRLIEQRLVAIERCGPDGALVRAKQKFFGKGDDLGNLISETLADARGDILSCTVYTYDSNGNVIEERLYGDLVGRDTPPIQMNAQGLPIENSRVACHIKKRFYSKDGFNLVVKQGDSKGGSIEYVYKVGTDLLVAQFVLDGEFLRKRSFFEYDDNSCLKKQILDDGWSSRDKDSVSGSTERQIQEITLANEFPSTLPKIITEKYYDRNTRQEHVRRKQFFTYDKQGRLLSHEIEGACGEKQTESSLTYDSKGLLLEEKDRFQTCKKYSYNDRNAIASITTGNKKEMFSYDDKNQLIQKTECYSSGKTFFETYEYDIFGNKTAAIDIFGNKTLYVYDSFNRLTTISLPEIYLKDGSLVRPIKKYIYDSFDRVASKQDSEGYVTHFLYNIRGKPTLIRYPDGTKERFAYDTEGSIHRKSTRDGFVLVYLYDFFGRVQSVETFTQGEKGPAEFQSKRTYEYNALHVTNVIDERGYKLHSTYDSAGKLIQVEGISGWNDREEPLKVGFEYDGLERISSYKEWFGKKEDEFLRTIFRYDVGDRPLEVRREDTNGRMVSLTGYEYDSLGNRTKTCLQGLITECVTYNDLNEPLTITDAYGKVTSFEYDYSGLDEKGRRIFTKTILDPLGTKKTNYYDSYGALVSSFSENRDGKLLDKKEITFDLRRNISEESTSLIVNGKMQGQHKTQYAYDAMNRLLLIEEGGVKKEFKYNQYGQLSQRYEPGLSDPITYSYSYQLRGVHVTIEYPIEGATKKASMSLYLDPMGRLKKMTSTDGLKIERTYGYLNQVLQEIVSLSNVGEYTMQYKTDRLGRTTNITLPDSSSVQYDYDMGFLKEIIRYSSMGSQRYSHQYLEYNTCGHPTKEALIGFAGERDNEHTHGFQKTGVVTDFYKEHISQENIDPLGNILSTTKESTTHAYTVSFSYNELSQILSEQGIMPHTYEYDSLGNHQTIDGEKVTINSLHQLLAFSNLACTYDERGSLRTKTTPSGVLNCSYDAFQHLTKMQKSYSQEGGKEIQFFYDSLGRRIAQKETNNGESHYNFFLYMNNEEIGLLSPNGSIQQLKVPGLENFIAFELNQEIFAPLFDLQNNVVSLINPDTRDVIESYEYSTFGEEKIFNQNGDEVEQSQVHNPWRFFSKRKDDFTGFVFFEMRAYDPSLRRWTAPDPLGPIDSVNLYLYTKANPLKYKDDFGLSAESYYVQHESFEAYIASERQHQSDCMGEIGTLERRNAPSNPGRSGNFVEICSIDYTREQIIDKLKNEKEFSDHVIGHINGIRTTSEEVYRRAANMIRNSKDQIVAVIVAYNATEGVGPDLLEASDNISYRHTRVERELTAGLVGVFNELKDAKWKIRIAFHCHSQGAAIMDCILHNTREFDPNSKLGYREYLGSMYTYGGASFFSEALNFWADGDAVPVFNTRNTYFLADHPDRVQFTSHRNQTVGEAHAFEGASYQEAFNSVVNSMRK